MTNYDSTPEGSDTPTPALNVQDAPAGRTGSQRRWVQVAAATIGAVAIGVGGYALGNGTADTAAAPPAAPTVATSVTPTSPSKAPVVTSAEAEAPAVAPDTVAPVPMQGATPAAGGVESARSADSKMIAGPGGRIVFTAGDGLSTAGGTGAAWTFDAASVFSAKTAEEFAAKLGIKGEARKEYGSWTVGSADGTSPSLSLSPDGTASLNYSDPTLDPWKCESDAAAGSGTEGGPAVDVPADEPCKTVDLGDAPQGDKAIAVAKDLLSSLGVDVEGLKFTAPDAGDVKFSYVTAELLIDGKASGVSWSVNLVGEGVQSLYGPVAPVVSLGDYDVISAKDAVARLTDPRFGAVYGGPILYDATVKQGVAVDGDVAEEPAEPTVPPLAEAGAPIAWAVSNVTITSAELGTTNQYQPDGSTLIIPAYILSADDGSQWTVNAIADSGLDFTAGS